ncbi:hypothetical protein [Nocardia aurantiaca]|uniref:Secreted protein n=1 Tax=Nocardia aurantiaca TaxID=2675850 RepID=A0A6I3KWS1_9NOCA|nr:hypothetical protein [Nocardia aurantiaca]MTE14492.1 hypothetical protein [Nocardia aurantiaca]
MKTVVLKACAVAAIASGLGAAPAMAAPVGLEPAAPETASVAPVAGLVPETGSAGAYNSITCALKTFSASMPCLLT